MLTDAKQGFPFFSILDAFILSFLPEKAKSKALPDSRFEYCDVIKMDGYFCNGVAIPYAKI